jgi:predicted O-methyltransferase YrrM
MEAMERHARETGFPSISPAAGYFCYQIARMIGARRVFELGSGYGYSTAWFAKAVQENGGGEVHHVVWDAGLTQKAQKHLEILGYNDVVKYHTGEAVQTLEGTSGPFDLIFNDIDKEAYPASLPIIAEKLRSGGVLIVDNMLWSGRVFDGNDQAKSTKAIRELTRLLTDDPGWISTIVPVWDGMVMAYKK